jgi:hypothetical protein
MADEGEDTLMEDECADNLSDVPIESDDREEVEDIASPEIQSEAESLDDSEISARRILRTLRLPTDTDESDEDDQANLTTYDLPKIAKNRRRKSKRSRRKVRTARC